MALDAAAVTLEDVQRLYDRSAYVQPADPEKIAPGMPQTIDAQKNQAARARSQAVMDVALNVGVRAGLAWQLGNIDRAIRRRERDLDTIYNFASLMIQDRVVPPVITEARDLYTQQGDFTLRLSGALYKVEYQARFASTPPNWREYLAFEKPRFDRTTLMSALLPRNDEEKRVWSIAAADGWSQGVEQANLMLQSGMDRMNRDFIGMLRFHTFVQQGKVSMPAIAGEAIEVTQEGGAMAVDETLLRITTLPQFNGDITSWKSSIISSPGVVSTPSAPAIRPAATGGRGAEVIPIPQAATPESTASRPLDAPGSRADTPK